MNEVVSIPLALSQTQILLDQTAWPESCHFNVGGTGFINGPFDVARFRESLIHLVTNNAALRTSVDLSGVQTIHPHWHEELLEFIDLSHEQNAEAKAMEICRAAFAKTFELEGNKRPWQMMLIKLSEQSHLSMARFHHLIMDGYSVALTFRELGRYYDDLQCASENTDIPTFQDFVESSVDYQSTKAWLKDQTWWQNELPSQTESLIPTNHSGDNSPAPSIHHFYFVERAAYQEFSDFCQQQSASTYHLYGAALATYFAGIYQKQEIIIGVPVLNRGGKRFKNTLGMFAVLLPLKITVSPQMSARELIQLFARKLKELYRHARYPLHEIMRQRAGNQKNGQNQTSQEASQDSHRLFDIILSYELHDFSVSFGEANLRTIKRSFAPVTRYPLTFCICEFHRDDPIEIAIDACSSHFDKSETKNIGERIHTIVNQIFDEPDKKVSDIELVTPAEKRQLLDIGTAPIPEQHQSNQVGETVLHKIQHWVQTTPDAIAVKTAHQSFSYAQLQQLMDKNISQLMHQGIGKGDRIALALERSPETLVLLLAISRLGGVYVPMDPHSSTEHLKSLITECQANLVVHQLDTDAFDDLDIQSASWQQWQVKLDTQDEENAKLTPLPLPKASDPVYILFTSGSSGKPKGVLMSHSALASRIRWLAQKLAYSTTDVALQSIALTFDPAQIEIYLPLTSGACCALVPAGQLAPEQILAEVNNLGATSMIFVPTVLRLFLNALPNNQKTPLRLVICGGEQLEQQLAKRCTDKLAVRLFNLYGPTEACIFASWHEYQGLPPCKVIDNQTSQSITHQNPAVPIGAPVGDTQLLVLDEHDRLLPYGATGQLCIGGKGLANGYLDAEQTVARFIRSQNNQTCLYKTGDAVYWNPDQQLVFAGRIDRQLKLRGVRIEPDTIEPVLCSLNMVRLACVDIRQEQLCAWLELNTADGTTDSETAARQAEFAKQINQQLWNKLPAHYIPQRLFVVTQIPLLSSGKPDLKQLDTELSVELKDHSSKSAISENIIVEKSSGQNHDREIHTWLLQAWQEILFKENNAKNEQKAVPGIDASFLQLGGNSLTALSVLSRIDKHFGIKLTLSCFLQNDSIRKLTAVIKEQQCSVCINLSKHQLGKRIYIAASGHGDALRFQRLADALSPHAHVVMLQPPHDASIKQLASPKDIAQLYVDKIHDENYTGSFCLAGFSVGGVIALEAARLCQQQHLAIEDVVLLDTTYPNWFIRHTPLWKIILKWVEHANKQQLKNNQTNASQITPNHLFSDIGLWTQVSALQNYSMAKLDLPATLVTSTGYQLWYRWLFKPWSKVFSANFREHKLKGTHSSIFDTEKVTALRDMFFARLSEKS